MQFATPLYGPRRVAKCSTVFVNRPPALLYSDDWTQNWRARAAWISGRQRASDGSVLDFVTWIYPGYLAGMDLTANSHGIVYSVNSLFPKRFTSSGVGTAFVARSLLAASCIDDAIARAADIRVTTAMSYNIGSTQTGKLFQVEVTTGSVHGVLNIADGTSYFHGNSFTVLTNVSEYQMRPQLIAALALSSTSLF